MKYLFTWLILVLVLFKATYGMDPDSIFSRAGELYNAGSYEQAIEEWSAIEEQGMVSAALFFNLGNAYFRSNKLGEARLYYEKALLLDPRDEDINTNLEFVKTLLTDRFDEVPQFFLSEWWDTLKSFFLPKTWLFISLGFFILFLIFGTVYVVSGSFTLRRRSFFAGILFFLFSALFLYISSDQKNILSDPGTAIIMESSIVVKSAPRESSKDLFILHEGAKVKIESELEDWREIRISDGRKGWLPVTGFEEIRIIPD